MASEMGCELLLFWVMAVGVLGVKAIVVNMTGEWKSELGWEVTCMWDIPPNDRLQSIRLYNNGQQFLVYRPETHGSKRSQFYRTPDNLMRVDCEETGGKAEHSGRCVLTIEPYQPPTSDSMFSCEVSGERPLFRMDKKEYFLQALVGPEDPILKVAVQKEQAPVRVMLNCSSAGLPAPHIIWTVNEQKVPADFSGRIWNVTTKLWHVWSYFSSTPSDERFTVTCTPEVAKRDQKMTGHSTTYSYDANTSSAVIGNKFIIMTLPLLVFVR